jgi:hypothetical protein
MLIIFASLYVILYCWWAVAEQLALMARASGVAADALSYGITLHNQFMSLQRFGGFALGPLLGTLVLISKGTDSSAIAIILVVNSIALSLTIVCLILMYIKWTWIVEHLMQSYRLMLMYKYSIKYIFKKHHHDSRLDVISVETPTPKQLSRYVSITYIFTGASIGIINIFAVIKPEFSTVVLQANSLVTGVGNLVYNFKVIPLVSDLDINKRTVRHYKDLLRTKIVVSIILLMMVFSGWMLYEV